MFTHVVLFWQKPGTHADQRDALLRDCNALLSKIPTVKHLWAGPAAMTPREVVDNSYDIGLCVVFEDRAGHDVYQKHPLHEQFIANNKAHWERVQVYDFS